MEDAESDAPVDAPVKVEEVEEEQGDPGSDEEDDVIEKTLSDLAYIDAVTNFEKVRAQKSHLVMRLSWSHNLCHALVMFFSLSSLSTESQGIRTCALI